MVLAYLLILVTSAGVGLALRSLVSPSLGRALLAVGLGALVSAGCTMGLVAVGRIGFWSSGMIALLLFVIAGLVLPFAVVVSWGRL